MRYISSVIFAAIVFVGCYSFKGISIPADVKTFYVQQVKLTDFKAPPDTPELFMDQFRQKIRNQASGLKWDDTNPHIEFDCTISGFNVTNEGNREGNEVSLNKLTITIKVDYINNNNEDDNWSKSFSFGIPFDASQDLQEVQDGYIEDIFDQIAENIFNDALRIGDSKEFIALLLKKIEAQRGDVHEIFKTRSCSIALCVFVAF